MNPGVPVYALLAEFADPAALVSAAKHCARFYRDLDAYSPYAVDGLPEAIGFTRDRVPLFTLLGAIAGGAGIYLLQWYSAVIDYPINSGGRPLDSWPVFIPPTFELAVLGGALATFLGLLLLCGLPRLHHPIFEAEDFDLASRSRFFLAVRSSDPQFDLVETRKVLEELKPIRVVEVPA